MHVRAHTCVTAVEEECISLRVGVAQKEMEEGKELGVWAGGGGVSRAGEVGGASTSKEERGWSCFAGGYELPFARE